MQPKNKLFLGMESSRNSGFHTSHAGAMLKLVVATPDKRKAGVCAFVCLMVGHTQSCEEWGGAKK